MSAVAFRVATPQTIVNGRIVTNGGDRTALIRSIRQADRNIFGPAIGSAKGHVTIGASDTARPATVWLVRYDGRVLNVPIRAGENGGRTLAHRNVVRSIERLGNWTGVRVVFPMPASVNPAFRTAVLIQQGKGGPIIAAAKL